MFHLDQKSTSIWWGIEFPSNYSVTKNVKREKNIVAPKSSIKILCGGDENVNSKLLGGGGDGVALC